MITIHDTPAGKLMMPEHVTPDMIAQIISAGWEPAAASWAPTFRPLDRFAAKDASGATLALDARQTERGEWGWQVGSKYFMDNCYSEYCNWYRTLDQALAANPVTTDNVQAIGTIKADALSRAIVTTLNEPHEEANRRAWANITRPVQS